MINTDIYDVSELRPQSDLLKVDPDIMDHEKLPP